MAMVVPTVLVLILTGLIGWALYALIHKLDRMGGHGHGHTARNEAEPKKTDVSS